MLLALQWAGEVDEGGLAQPSDGSIPAAHRTRLEMSFSEATVAGHFAPVIDGHVLPADPFYPIATELSAHIPLLIGHDKEEANFFNLSRPDTFGMHMAALKKRLNAEFGNRATQILSVYGTMLPSAASSELYIAIATARTMGYETVRLTELKAAQFSPVYAYRWDYRSNYQIAGGHMLGAGHATDIGPAFDNWDEHGLHGDGPNLRAAAHNLSTLRTSFARDGKPAASGVPHWPRYETTMRPTMLINSRCRLTQDPDRNAREMWNAFYQSDEVRGT